MASNKFEEALVDLPSIQCLDTELRAALVAARVWVYEKNLDLGEVEAAKLAIKGLPKSERQSVIDEVSNFADNTIVMPIAETQPSFREKIRVATNPRV